MGRFFKRLTALSLSILVFLACLPLGALRALAVEGDVVYIGSVSDLVYLSEKCVQDIWSQELTVLLTTDLDLTGSEFTNIPLFSGTFDGQGHTISGFSVTNSGSLQGFFRQILEGGIVQNLNLVGTVLPDGTRQDVGGIAGANYGTIQNCSFSGTVGGTRAVGGIAGINQSNAQILDCRMEGIVGGEHRTGGIAGENLGLISGCDSSAAINTTYQSSVQTQEVDATLEADELLALTDAGGIAGYSSGIIQDCTNTGTVGYNHVGYNIGGIVGRQSGRIERCTNTGAVYGRKDVGGILGQMDPDTGWNLSGTSITALQDSLNDLQESLGTTIDHIENSVNAVGNVATDALNSIKRVESATSSVVREVEDWANLNLSALNELSDMLTLTLQRLGPIMHTLSGMSGDLSVATNALSDALNDPDIAAKLSPEQQQELTDAINNLTDLMTQSDELADVLDGDMDALDEANCLEDVVAVVRKLTDIPGQITAISDAVQAVMDIVGTIFDALGLTTLPKIAAAAEQLTSALGSLRTSAEMIAQLADELGSQPAVKFAMLDTNSASLNDVFDALSDISASIGSLKTQLTNNTIDLQDINDKFFAVLDTIVGMFDNSSNDAVSYTQDVSALEDETRTSGILRNCTNYGTVIASTNAGGVTGAITLDLTFDEENQWNLSALLGQGASYLIYAAVYNCASYAAVRADKTNAGGIVGRMDYGAVLYCEASGDITSAGDYAGGIAGQSTGTIYNCKARVNLSGDAYVGGIAGLGTNISSCYALPHIAQYTEYAGAIAGSSESSSYVSIVSQPIEFLGSLAEGLTSSLTSSLTGSSSTVTKSGIILENYYAESNIGGVDGFSFSGETDPVTYEQLLALTDNAPLFSSITVTFVAEGETIATLELPFGGSIDELPTVPDREGQYWVWDNVNTDAVYYSCTVTGSYRNLIPTLSTNEDPPLFLVEGAFHSGQILTAQTYTADLETLGASEEDMLGAYTLTVNEASGEMVARMYTTEHGTLYITDADGVFQPATYTKDGSYIVFTIENGASLVYLRADEATTMLYGGIAIGAAAAVLILVIFLRRKKSHTSDGDSTPNSED